MPTNYPNSIDSPTDPTAAQPMNAPSHSSQHANANDALVAIENFVGTNAAPKFAILASPTFTGAPKAPTQPALSANTDLATTQYADSAVAVEVSRAGAAELLKAPVASPTFTGTPRGVTNSTATDSSTQLATDAFTQSAVAVETSRAEGAEALLGTVAITTKTVGYTFALTNGGAEVDYNSSSGGTFTIPTNASVAFPVGAVISCRQMGSGQLTIVGAGGVTLHNGSSLYVTRAQYSLVALTQGAANVWYLDGDV
jgi:hypothetical protein